MAKTRTEVILLVVVTIIILGCLCSFFVKPGLPTFFVALFGSALCGATAGGVSFFWRG